MDHLVLSVSLIPLWTNKSTLFQTNGARRKRPFFIGNFFVVPIFELWEELSERKRPTTTHVEFQLASSGSQFAPLRGSKLIEGSHDFSPSIRSPSSRKSSNLTPGRRAYQCTYGRPMAISAGFIRDRSNFFENVPFCCKEFDGTGRKPNGVHYRKLSRRFISVPPTLSLSLRAMCISSRNHCCWVVRLTKLWFTVTLIYRLGEVVR